jgi:hypothetical protein
MSDDGGDFYTATAAAAAGLPENPMMMQIALKDIAVPHPHDVLCGRGECVHDCAVCVCMHVFFCKKIQGGAA